MSMKLRFVSVLVLVTALVLSASGVQAAETKTDIEITVSKTGDAAWKVTNTLSFTSQTEQQAFTNMINNQTRMQERKTSIVNGFRSLIRRASDDVERQMSIKDSTIKGSVGEDTGTLTVKFTWTNFAESTSEGRVVVGDMVSGLSLDEGERLTLKGPFPVANASSGTVDGSTVVWKGPSEVSENAKVVFEKTDGGTDGDGSGGGQGLPGFGLLIGGLAVAAAGLARICRS
ncbi:MAG: hypothetical protein SV760_04540 [Halobacteria archaeon]|nr:hypothetical protein [Halobacteria archaeon]